jgi:hypothetical protein
MRDNSSLLLASLFTLLAACAFDAPPETEHPTLRDDVVADPGGGLLPSSPCDDCRVVRTRDGLAETTLVIRHDVEVCRVVIAFEDGRALVDTCGVQP